jgi:hypothetical protein
MEESMFKQIRKHLIIDGIVVDPMKPIRIDNYPYSLFRVHGKIVPEVKDDGNSQEHKDYDLVIKGKSSFPVFSKIIVKGKRFIFFCRTFNDQSGYLESLEASDNRHYFKD